MGDLEGSSNAAQSAREQDETEHKSSWLRRLLGGGSGQTERALRLNGQHAPAMPRPTHGMINLRRMRVEDVAVPRAEITAVPDTITKDDLVQVFRSSGMTRLPVYSGTLDTPTGLVHLKDFALTHGFNGKSQKLDWKNMLRPLLFVPPSMPIGVLLTKMQTERRHMALVIDEYGGVDGLVTIEDLIEQVIGEIEDEHDADEGTYWTREKTGCYLVLSKTPLDEFEAEIGMDLTAHDEVDGEEIDTLGGLVFVLAGHVPARGEVVPHPAGIEFEVVDADPRRVKRLRVRMRKSVTAVAPGALAAAVVAEGAGQSVSEASPAAGPEAGSAPAAVSTTGSTPASHGATNG